MSIEKGMNIGIADIFVIIFVSLKLAGVGVVASWSWWLVFSPYLIVLGLYCLAGLCALAVCFLEKRK